MSHVSHPLRRLRALPSLALAALTLALPAAQAAWVDVQATQNQTHNLQLMNFSFGSLPLPAAGGTFTLRALGDYNTAFPSEVIDLVTLDGSTQAAQLGPNHPDVTLIAEDPFYSEWVYTATLDAATLGSLLADGLLAVQVQIGANSGVFPNDPRQPFVTVSLSYDSQAVPAPATAWLAAAGLLAAAAGLRRRPGRAGLR